MGFQAFFFFTVSGDLSLEFWGCCPWSLASPCPGRSISWGEPAALPASAAQCRAQAREAEGTAAALRAAEDQVRQLKARLLAADNSRDAQKACGVRVCRGVTPIHPWRLFGDGREWGQVGVWRRDVRSLLEAEPIQGGTTCCIAFIPEQIGIKV